MSRKSMSKMETSFFSFAEQRTYSKIVHYKEEIADSKLHDSPCPLLVSQLDELRIMATKMVGHIDTMLANSKSDT